MKVYRWMSNEEFDKLTAGVPMINTNKFINCRTDSAGFCFLPEKVEFDSLPSGDWSADPEHCVWDPASAYEFLNGIVSDDVLVEFEVSEEARERLHKGYGVYCDP